MSSGFNSQVDVDGVAYHVQTELCRRGQPRIETAVFVNGAVQWATRRSLAGEGAGMSASGAEAASGPVRGVPAVDEETLREWEARTAEQHQQVLGALRDGSLRGQGPELLLEWCNEREALARFAAGQGGVLGAGEAVATGSCASFPEALLEVRQFGRPLANARVAIGFFLTERGEEPANGWQATRSDGDGRARLAPELPRHDGRLYLMLEAEAGLSLCRKRVTLLPRR